MVRRTKEEAQGTRERLLDTAEALFLERGLSHTALQDIAQAAGLTRGAIYWHFADKVALVQALFDRVDLPLEQALAEAERSVATDPMARLYALAMAPFDMIRDNPRVLRVLTLLVHRAEFVGELAPLMSRHDSAISDCTLRMERLFEAAQRAGHLAEGMAPRTAALALLALVDGLLRLTTLDDGCRTVLPATAPAVQSLLNGLRAPRPVAAATPPVTA